MLILFYISMFTIMLKFDQAILTRTSSPFCLSYFFFRRKTPVDLSNSDLNFVKWNSLVVSTLGKTLFFTKIRMSLQLLLFYSKYLVSFLIEFDVSSSQFIYRISVPLKSIRIINRSIFSLQVIFVVAVQPCFRGTQRLFSVRYLFGEAKIAYNFLLLEEG